MRTTIGLVLALTLAACADSRQPAQSTTQSAATDIVDTAASAGQFKTLVAAVKAAGLEDALRGDGPLTVFAPTDEAFSKLPKGTVESLLRPENKGKLAAILKYHVVGGKVMASEAAKLTSAPTLEGKSLRLRATADGLSLNEGAKVVKADIETRNGVIHVIDQVVLPD